MNYLAQRCFPLTVRAPSRASFLDSFIISAAIPKFCLSPEHIIQNSFSSAPQRITEHKSRTVHCTTSSPALCNEIVKKKKQNNHMVSFLPATCAIISAENHFASLSWNTYRERERSIDPATDHPLVCMCVCILTTQLKKQLNSRETEMIYIK